MLQNSGRFEFLYRADFDPAVMPQTQEKICKPSRMMLMVLMLSLVHAFIIEK